MPPRKGHRTCQQCRKNRALKFFSPKGRICSSCQSKSRSKGSHEARVMETYGLLKGEWDKLFEYQGGKCSICGGKRRYRLHTDHSHKSGLVRGLLLCKTCNSRLLPAAKDNPEILQAAIDYLRDPPAGRVLGERLHIDFRDGEK